jgi:hypothetical protein
MPWVQVGIMTYIKTFSQISRHELFFKLCLNLIKQNDQDFLISPCYNFALGLPMKDVVEMH